MFLLMHFSAYKRNNNFWSFGPINVFIDARYGLGLANTIDSDDVKNTNSVITVSAGVRLGLF